jgi:ABC-type transport system involved in cytochrome bd biosynthesis fused ATPase/permease subunit
LVVGKKGQGISSFVHMLVGSMKKIKGSVFLSGKIAYLPEKFEFASATVKENIAFYNSNVEEQQIRMVYNKLELREEIKYLDGLSLMMNKEEGFTSSQLQKISLARVLCSSADVYILDNPFNHLSADSISVVENLLREKQEQGVMVIMAIKNLDMVDPNDQVLILDEGVSVEYGRFKDLATNAESRVLKFFKNKKEDDLRKK